MICDAVALDRALADAEPQRDGLAGEAFDHEIHDLHLARREPLEPAAQLLERLLAHKLVEDARQASVDGGQQMRVVHRLLDEILRARP